MMQPQKQELRRRARGRRRRPRGQQHQQWGRGLPLPSAVALVLLVLLATARVCQGFRGSRVSSFSVATRGGGPGAASAASRRGLLRVLSTAAAPESSSSSSSSPSSGGGPGVVETEEQQGPTVQQTSAAVSSVLSSRGGSSPLQGTLLEPYHYVVPPLVAPKQKAWWPKGGRAGQRQQEELEAAAAEGQAVGVISHHEALELLCLREGVGGRGGRKGFYYHEGVSLDLGRTETMVVVSEEGISLPSIRDRSRRGRPALVAAWDELEEIVAQAQSQGGQLGCYALYADGTRPWRISVVSLKTGRAANLLPSRYVKGPPTVVLGSFLMHRLEGARPGSYIGPAEDTRRKLDAIKMKKVYGKVLDTTTGLGYTAIAAARCAHVSEVVTIEADQAALEMCRYNPWSSDLFLHQQQQQAGVAAAASGSSSGRKHVSPIHVLQGDVCELVKGFGDGTFAAVMHDPPAMALGGKASSALYSAAFYGELYRVLRWRGRLFHFVGGNPKGKENSRLYKSVVQRLEAAGFKKVMILASAQGVVAEKGEDRKSKKALHSPQGQGGKGGGGYDRRGRRGGPGHRRDMGDFLGWGGGEFGWDDGYGAAFGFL